MWIYPLGFQIVWFGFQGAASERSKYLHDAYMASTKIPRGKEERGLHRHIAASWTNGVSRHGDGETEHNRIQEETFVLRRHLVGVPSIIFGGEWVRRIDDWRLEPGPHGLSGLVRIVSPPGGDTRITKKKQEFFKSPVISCVLRRELGNQRIVADT